MQSKLSLLDVSYLCLPLNTVPSCPQNLCESLLPVNFADTREFIVDQTDTLEEPATATQMGSRTEAVMDPLQMATLVAAEEDMVVVEEVLVELEVTKCLS